MNMYEAIFVRKSVKKFVMEELEQTILDQIRQFAEELPLVNADAPVEFAIVDQIAGEKINTRLSGTIAPYYFIAACDNDKSQMLNTGFLMEQITLYIASRGLGTSTLNHVHLKTASIPEITKDIALVIGFGRTNEVTLRDRRKLHRIPEKEMVLYKTDVNNDVKLMVKAARLAPSYWNTQPWRLVVYENRIHVFAKRNMIITELLNEKKYLDVGVMVANMLLVAEELWIDVSIEKSENISNKYIKNNEYIFTIIVK